jgi:PIN domain nuclease of toxin-antitoxin system
VSPDRLLLDTHILLWLNQGASNLRAATRALIETTWQAGGTILFSAVSIWEIAALIDKGRISLDAPLAAWVDRFLDRPGVAVVPLDHHAAALAYQVGHLRHRDPADRLLIATAMRNGCPLVTYDDRILRFGRDRGSQYGFSAVR